MAGKLSISSILLGCCLSLFLSSCQEQPGPVQEPTPSDIALWLPPEPCEPLPCGSGLGLPFKGIPGMENVIQASPPQYLNAFANTEVTVYYRKPIATPDAELANAITVRDGLGNLVPGTLAISPDRTFLRFCAAEPYATASGRYPWEPPRPEGTFFVDFQAVEFMDGDTAKAFSIEFMVDYNPPTVEPPLKIPLGAKPCDDYPIPADYTVLRTP